MQAKGILAFDIDGTLTHRNHENIEPGSLADLLKDLDEFGYYSIPVTGKPASYGLRIMDKNNLRQRGVIAENAGVYVRQGETNPVVFGPGKQAIDQLKVLLGLNSSSRGVINIVLDSKKYEVVVDPEDISILTIFTDPYFVKHRWEFTKSIDVNRLYQQVLKIITSNKLQDKLHVLPPFPDGAFQVIRKDPLSGRAIDKSWLPELVATIYDTDKTIPIAMFGDGHNDIPAMKPKSVIPLTFTNAEEEVKEVVAEKKGYISPLPAPDGLGVVDCLYWLAQETEFFKEKAMMIRQSIAGNFPDYKP